MSKRYTIYVVGHNMTSWIREQPVFLKKKTEIGELTDIPNIDLLGDNTRHVWSPGHSNSILDANWYGEPVVIWDRDLKIYEGEIRNINIGASGREAVLQTTARINRILGRAMVPYISIQKTLSELSEDIYLQYGIETDSISYSRTREKQEDILLQARANITLEESSTLLNVQQWLADVGMCRHYFVDDIAYMEFVDPLETRYSMHTFVDEEIIDISSYEAIEQNIYDGYTINTASGQAKKVGVNPAPQLDVGIDQNFIIATPEAGYNWGDAQIELSKRNRYRIVVHFAEGQYSNWIDLNSVFTIQSNLFGITKDFEVLEIDTSSQLGPIITGESV